MITGYINGQELRISSPALAADSIKYLEAEFHFAGHDWDGFTKTAYFLNDGKKIALTLADDRITADMGLNLTEGEWAVKLSGVKGDARITTTTQRLYVRGFGSTDGELPDVTATSAEQLQAQIGDLDKLKTKAKSDLVAAINEAAQSGGGVVADSDIFVIPVAADLNEETGEGSTTVSFDEIIEAHNEGKTLLCAAKDSAQGLSAILTEYMVTPTRAAFIALIEGGMITLTVAISKSGTATKAQYAINVGGVALTQGFSYTDKQKAQLRENFDLAAKTDKLANPNALTFTGAVTGTYDGSEALTVNIPADGDEAWEYIGEATCAENATSFLMDKDSEGNAFALKAIAIITYSPAFTGDTVGSGRGLGVYPTTAWGWGQTPMGNAPAAKNNEIARYELHYFRLYGDSMRLIERFASQNVTNARGNLMRQNAAGDAPISFDIENADDPFALRFAQFTGPATCVKIVGYINTAISAGTKVKVWGVRT